MDSNNHVLLEVFCIKTDAENIVDCKTNCPTYECIVKGCKYCTFTSHENALCYIDNSASASHIISLGGEMLPDNVCKQEAEALWEKISHEAIEKAYEKYMKDISK